MVHRYLATAFERDYEVTVEEVEGGFRVSVDGRSRIIDARELESGTWSLVPPAGGPARIVDIEGGGPDYAVGVAGITIPLRLVEGRRAELAAVAPRPRAAGPQPVRAPMPGKVVRVLARVGDAVKAGQGLVIIEAMKMENELRAPRDGVITEVAVAEAQPVEAGQALVLLA